MKKSQLISIIVPVYNVEKYIKQCLESIISQTYLNMEIIIINDGTKDNSGKICDEYAKKDNRINVIHKENEGVSKARNVGLDIAKGEYIIFIDSDDFVEKDYVEKLYNLCVENEADFSICGTNDIDNDNNIIKKSKKLTDVLSGNDIMKEFFKEEYFTSVIWAKMYKSSIFNNIRFNETTKIAEDLEILYKVIRKSKKVAIDTSKILYNYRIRENSATSTKYNSDWEKVIQIRENIICDIEKYLPELTKYAIHRYVKTNVACISKLIQNDEHNQIKELRNNIIKYKKHAYFCADIKFRIKIYCILNNIELYKKIFEIKRICKKGRG